MRSIDILRPHGLTHPQAIKLVQAMADDIAAQYSATYHWEEEVLRFERSGIKGAVHILPKQVHIRAELGFLLMPLRGAIEAHIIQFLDEHAGSPDASKTQAALRKLAGDALGDEEETPVKATPRKAVSKTPAKKAASKAPKKETKVPGKKTKSQ